MKAKSSKGKAINRLYKTLQKNLPQNKARTKFIAKFVYAIISACTVNSAKIINHFDNQAKKDSKRKQVERFLRFFEYSKEQFAKFIFILLGLFTLTLTFDRTNWDFGKIHINILMLAVVYKGIAFPIFWKVMNKKGNSNTQERIELMQEFLRIFGKDKIENFLADREFIGEKWLAWLVENDIPFTIRLRENFIVENTHLKNFFRNLEEGENRFFIKTKKVLGLDLYLAGTRIGNEYLIVASNYYPENALENYLKRWEIETLFGCLKSRGFNLEDSHIFLAERIDKLVYLLSVAFSWAHKIGEWLHEIVSIEIKKHGRSVYSFFRYGLDYLQEIISNIETKFKEFSYSLVLLKVDYS